MSESIEKRSSFNFIRYSNCWEDAEVLVKSSSDKNGGNFLSIASAGDNCLSLLVNNPEMVIALDLSIPQCASVELKKASIINLSYEETLSFLGVTPSVNRIEVFNRLKNNISKESIKFFDNNLKIIKNGIIHSGKFENYFKIFRLFVLPFILSKKNVLKLLDKKSHDERLAFYEKVLNTRRWRLLFKIFFGKSVMGKLGRDAEFFRYADDDVTSTLIKRVKYALTQLEVNENPYLEYILLGNFKNTLPHYLKKINYDKIKLNIDKLNIYNGKIEDMFLEYKEVKFDFLNLSDIFEYMDLNLYKELLNILINNSNKNAKLFYWNMAVKRNSLMVNEKRLEINNELTKKLFLENKAFFYDDLVIEEVINQ